MKADILFIHCFFLDAETPEQSQVNSSIDRLTTRQGHEEEGSYVKDTKHAHDMRYRQFKQKPT